MENINELNKLSNEKKYSRKKIVPGFIILGIGAIVLYFLINHLNTLGVNNEIIPSFGEIIGNASNGNAIGQVLWSIMDFTQGSFHGLLPASILMIIFGFVSAYMERNELKYSATGIDGIGDIFNGMFIAVLIGLLLNTFIWGYLLDGGYAPTFAPLLVIQAFVMFYGAEKEKLATITLTSVALTFPITYWALQKLVFPYGLPIYMSVSVGVIVTVLVGMLIFKFLPWMNKGNLLEADSKVEVEESSTEVEEHQTPDSTKSETLFFINRVFADVGQLNMWGSTYVGIAMYIGVLLSVYLNPAHGGDMLGLLTLTQMLAIGLSVFVYYSEWKENGWAYTFASGIFISAIVLTYPPIWQIVVPSIIVGAIGCPWLTSYVSKQKFAQDKLPGLFYTQIGVGILVVIWSLIIMNVIIPLVG